MIVERSVNLGVALRKRLEARAKRTRRTAVSEMRFLAMTGLSHLAELTGDGELQLSLIDRPETEPTGRKFYSTVRAPQSFWDAIDALAAWCALLKWPGEKRGRPSHVSRALRIATWIGIEILTKRPSLDPAPRRRKAELDRIKAQYGDWDEKPDWSPEALSIAGVGKV